MNQLKAEYSRLRDIAHKRIKRMEQAGQPARPDFPKLRGLTEDEVKANIKELRQFVEAGPSLQRTKETARKIAKEAKTPARAIDLGTGKAEPTVTAKQRKSEYNKRYREILKSLTKEQKAFREWAKEKGIKGYGPSKVANLTAKQLSILKAANTLGYNVPPNDIKVFLQYAEERFAVSTDSQYYTIANIVQEYDTLRDDLKLKPKEIESDLKEFKADLARRTTNANNLKGGVNAEKMLDFFQRKHNIDFDDWNDI